MLSILQGEYIEPFALCQCPFGKRCVRKDTSAEKNLKTREICRISQNSRVFPLHRDNFIGFVRNLGTFSCNVLILKRGWGDYRLDLLWFCCETCGIIRPVYGFSGLKSVHGKRRNPTIPGAQGVRFRFNLAAPGSIGSKRESKHERRDASQPGEQQREAAAWQSICPLVCM